eukprot:COSAG02_NODE_1383_length_12965_cov_60.828463_10_plen_68_part_00
MANLPNQGGGGPGEARGEVESIAGGLGPSETGAGFGPTPAACGQTSEVASAPAPTHDSTAAKSRARE